MNERDVLMLQRRKKRIKLREVANYMNCSVSLISQYELGYANMIDDKVQAYKRYIQEER